MWSHLWLWPLDGEKDSTGCGEERGGAAHDGTCGRMLRPCPSRAHAPRWLACKSGANSRKSAPSLARMWLTAPEGLDWGRKVGAITLNVRAAEPCSSREVHVMCAGGVMHLEGRARGTVTVRLPW